MTLLVIRPVSLEDLDALLELAALTGFGLTTLPRDREYLTERIMESETSFERSSRRPHGEVYLFVMEDLQSGKVVGTSAVTSKVGGFEPFYAYKVETSVHTSEMLNVRKEIKTLHLVTEHNGPCEIGSLFLRPDYQKGGNGRLLSLSRFLFMQRHRERFDPVVIAEMRGVIDEQGHSPFWDAVGKHFLEIDFPKADYLSLLNKKFIADLMPRHPLYIPLLPQSAQGVIGQVHEQTRPAMRILEGEGFALSGMVDIFDAGPIMICQRDEIRTIKEAAKVAVVEIGDEVPEARQVLISNTRRAFRACRGMVELKPAGKIRITTSTALALQLKIGDEALVGTMRAHADEGGNA
jgi:arginine N-succinyltransferase